jgi:3'-phosphoadenosine 5'-phosphosulfate sulfotransferase (PAPS reductase)/FAD synthetase
MENLQTTALQQLFTTPPRPVVNLDLLQSEDRPPLVVMCGVGVDSSALLARFKKLGIRPDLIIFADTGSEKDATYAYKTRLEKWLEENDFPSLTVLEPIRERDISLEAHLLRLGIFASISYARRHSCSIAWKLEVSNRFLNAWEPFRRARESGGFIVRCVGFNADEGYRVARAEESVEKSNKRKSPDECNSENKKNSTGFSCGRDDDHTISYFPLIELGMDRSDCLLETVEAGLGFVPKSSCTFCAAMTEKEVRDLERTEPHKFFRCLMIEHCVRNNEIVPHTKIRGIRYGDAYSDLDVARPYQEAVARAYHEFDLKRTAMCGENGGWQIKKIKVERFLNFFSSAENLRRYMAGDYELPPLDIPEAFETLMKDTQGELFYDDSDQRN